MARYEDTLNMNVPSKGGTTYSYGAIKIELNEIKNIQNINYNEQHFPAIPVSGILHEGVISHLSIGDRFDIPQIEEHNPYYVKTIYNDGDNKKIVCESIPSQCTLIQTYSLDRDTLTMELRTEEDTIKNSGKNGPNCIEYNLIPDEILCKDLDISSDIISQII